MKVKVNELERLVKKALLKKYGKKEIEVLSGAVMFGELSGKKSHGLVRLLVGKFSILAQNPKKKPLLIRKTKISTLIDSEENPGMLIGSLAMNEVIRLAKKSGIGIVGTKCSFTTSGSLSYYLEKIAKENLIAIIMARAPGDVAPYGGLERLFGTNPISFGIPAQGNPIIFDMSTSAISYGAVLQVKTKGEQLPDNVAIDMKGKVTRDPDEAIRGAFLTFDRSYKGSGLAMIVEILAGILPGADYLDKKESDGWGNLFIAVDPNILLNRNEFKRKVRDLVETVRNSRTKDGSKVRIPGENTLEMRNKAIKTGYVDVDEKLIGVLRNYIRTGELSL